MSQTETPVLPRDPALADEPSMEDEQAIVPEDGWELEPEEERVPGDDDDLDLGDGDDPQIQIQLTFLAAADMASADVWKRCHELILSADSKGLKLFEGTVTDYGVGDE